MTDAPAAGTMRDPGGTAHPMMIGAVLVLATALNPVSNDTILPGIPFLQREFDITPDIAQLTLTLHIIAFAVMQLVYGPLADRFGRRPVLLASLVIYAFATVVCVISPTLDVLLVGRVLQGIGAAGGPVIARAIIRDIYGAERAGKVMSYVMAAFGVLTIVFPIVGGVLVAWFGWRPAFYFCLGYAGVIMLFIVLVLHETLTPDKRQTANPIQIFANMRVVARQPVFIVNTLSNCAMYAGMWAWLSACIYLLIEVVHLPVERATVYFAISEAGFMLGALLAGRMATTFRPGPLVIAGGIFSLAAVIGMWACASVGIVNAAALTVPGFLWMFGYGFFYPYTMAAAVAPFPKMAGTASSLIGFLQMMCGAAAAYLTGLFFDGTAGPLGLLMVALTVTGLLVYVAGRKTA